MVQIRECPSPLAHILSKNGDFSIYDRRFLRRIFDRICSASRSATEGTAMASCTYSSTALRQSIAFANSPPSSSGFAVARLLEKQHPKCSSSGIVVARFQQKQRLRCSFFANELESKRLRQTCCGSRVAVNGFSLPFRGAVVASAAPSTLPEALLFDCDGVLVDTERDGHRVSFNLAFSEKGLDTVWDVELYGELLKIGGGKERMTHYFNKFGWPKAGPSDIPGRKELVVALHKQKTEIFMDLVEKGSLPLRPGVARLVDQALDNGVNVAVCSTSNEKAVAAIVRIMLGPERASKIRIFAGDVVPRKKPDPAIYLLASTTIGVAPERCVVVEDSHIGLTAAKAAGMKCIVTKSGYTEEEDFSAADAVFDSIGDPPTANFDLEFAASLLSLPADVVA